MIFARQDSGNRQTAVGNAAQSLQARPATRNSRILPQPVLMFAVKDECALRLPAATGASFVLAVPKAGGKGLKTPV
jgi:hypothetical protein